MFYNFVENGGPQAVVLPFGETENVMEKHLKGIKKMDDLPIAEWMEKSKNNETEFAVTEGDDDTVRNQKESQRRWFSFDDRFQFEKRYASNDQKMILNSDRLLSFIKDIQEGKI